MAEFILENFSISPVSTSFKLKGLLMIKQENYCSSNHVRNFSIETDSITIGIELCKIPHISEHCEITLRLFNVMG